jgi:ribosomal peptide maturation radical SAM protein 1
MHENKKNVLLLSMPFAGADIPSIQLGLLEAYLKERDINIQTRHLYLKAADFYGIDNYNFLIYPPNDSYNAQMIYSKYVFPEHFKENIEKFKDFFNKIKLTSTENKLNLSWEDYISCTDDFYDWVILNVDWHQYDIIGFTLNYGQFLPSLAIAKKIKEIDSKKIIVFGGSRTVGKLGKKVLDSFPYVDFIVSGEGEESLYRLAWDFQNYDSIPNLIYRRGNEVILNKREELIDLNFLPIPCYDSFYQDLNSTSNDMKQFFSNNGKLPIEISRGCWWNKCTFCNLNIQHNKYREKNVDKIIKEIENLSTKYQVLKFQIMSNNILAKDYKILCEKIKNLRKNLSFFAEVRADQLKSDDYTLLKEAGFNTIQTGIESFSSNYLDKINKGTRVIDNIATLKFCRENKIKNYYNLIINYPNEEEIDFEETKITIQLFKQYIDPPQICNLRVVYGSPIQCNPHDFNIEHFEYSSIDELMFPKEFLDKGFNFVYEFKQKENTPELNWVQLIENWKEERKNRRIKNAKTQTDEDEYIFYFVDGRDFLRIYDNRTSGLPCIYNLNALERKIFLSCIDVINFDKLKNKFPDISEKTLHDILTSFEESDIIYREDESYLNLPLRYSLVDSSLSVKDSRSLEMVTNIS